MRSLTGPRLWTIDISPTSARALAVFTPTLAPSPPPALILPDTDDEDDETPQTASSRMAQHEPTHPSMAPPPTPQAPVTTQPCSTVTPQRLRTRVHLQAYDLPNTPTLIAYLHATAGYPVKSTWLAAIRLGYYKSWPGLTHSLAAKYCPNADETHLGHMAQPRQNIRSTRHQLLPHVISTSPPPPLSVTILEVPLTRLFSDDTGRFTPRARSGNQYIMVALHASSNAILVRPFASKHDAHRIAAYKDIYDRLATVDRKPTIHILDNEASRNFQQAITANGCSIQLVPPHVHRRNAAERAIRTFKDHFLSMLAGVAPTFPADRWDLLLPQAELTLNLLRPSPDSTKSAWENLFGPYNFDATPMGPAGSRILIHNKATLRRSWDFRCREGFYIGPALTHYRCYKVLSKDSKAVTVSDAITF